MKRIAIALVYIFFASQLAWAACPDGSVGPVCNNVSGPTQVNEINNAFNGTTGIAGMTGSTGAGLTNFNLNKVFYPDAYGASGSTLTITAATTASNPIIVASGSVSDFKVGQGVHIPLAGGAEAHAAGPGTLSSVTCNGSCSGAHTYSYVVVTADPFNGMSAAYGATANTPITKTSMPAISTLNNLNYFTFAGTNNTTGPLIQTYLIYRSYDSGPYQFVFADSNLTSGVGTADFGQSPSDGRGWPTTLTGGAAFAGRNQDFFSYITAINGLNITLNDAPTTSVGSATVYHDDTLASQNAVLAAEAAGGGRVQWGPHTYNIQRPAFWNGSAWTRTYNNSVAAGWAPRIYVESNNMEFAGDRGTTLYNRPDQYFTGVMFSFGTERTRFWDKTYYVMSTVNQGDTKITLTTPSDTSNFSVGDDVGLFFGAFTASCAGRTSPNRPGVNCSFVELNSITAIDSTNGYLYLKYAAGMTFRNDGTNPFGVVDINPTTESYHNIYIHDLTFDTESTMMASEEVINQQIYNSSSGTTGFNGGIGGSISRKANIHDNSFVIGDGGGQFHTEQEYDHDTDFTFTDNNFRWNVAPGIKGTYQTRGIDFTEGESGIHFLQNKFTDGIIEADCSTNDFSFIGNSLSDSAIDIGLLVADGCSLASFGTPNSWTISGNNLYGDHAPANNAILQERNVVLDNVISDNNTTLKPADVSATVCVKAASGVIAGNTCSSNTTANYPIGIDLYPQNAGTASVPALPINVIGNHIDNVQQGNGTDVEDPGATWAGQINLLGNVELNGSGGTGDTVSGVNHTAIGTVIKVIGENISSPTLYTPAYLADVAQSVSTTIYSVAGTAVPACAAQFIHQTLCVSDATACTSGTTYTGSSSTKCKLQCDGTNWKETGAGCF